MKLKGKRIRRIALWSALFIAVAVLATLFVPIPPHGRFSTPQIANLADAYFEAADGKLTQVVFDGESGRQGEELRHFVGTYRKERGRWVLVTRDGSTGQLCATLSSLQIIDERGQRAGPFFRYEIYKGR